MAKADEFAITPEQCLAALPELELDTSDRESEEGWRRAELRHSLLAITELNHVNETAIVRAVAQNALGRLPEFEE